MTYEPLDIIGVITEDVGQPRNDGSPGSGLYRVPIRLSRSVNSDEARYLVQLWDNPPSFSMMHRAGIAEVIGDRFTLDGTTVGEVRDYHAKTLRLIVDRLNIDMSAHLAKQAEAQAREEAAEAEHRRQVAEIADDIRFE